MNWYCFFCVYYKYIVLFVSVYLIIRYESKKCSTIREFNSRMETKRGRLLNKLRKLPYLMHLFRPVTLVILLPKYFVDYVRQFYCYFGLFGLFGGNKIKRHRELYAENGRSLLWFSAKGAFFVPFALWLVSYPCACSSHSNMGIWTDHPTDNTNVFWYIICQYLDPGNVAYSNDIGSFIALLSATVGIVCLSGFLLSAIVNVISQTRQMWQKGLINYYGVKEFKDYVVIIGINEQTASIARRALESDDNRYVLIQTRQDVEKARPELESKIDDDKQDRIVYYAGDRTSYEDIEKLRLENAREVYILGESAGSSDKESYQEQSEKEHDAYNISCLEHISTYMKDIKEKSLKEARKKFEKAEKKLENAKKEGAKEKELKKCEDEYDKCKAEYQEVFYKSRLNVHVQFDYQSTFTAFKTTHLYQKLGRDIRFIPFNIQELWAKKVLVDNLAIYPAGNKTELKVQRYNPIDTYVDEKDNHKRKGITVDCHKTVHLVILGMNQMGTALATQAALLCHFPNFAKYKSEKTVITFIDDNAIRESEYYMDRYSTLFELSRYRVISAEKGVMQTLVDYNAFDFRDKSNIEHYAHLVNYNVPSQLNENCLLDVEWEFIQGNAASKSVQDYIKGLVVTDNNKKTNKTVTIAVCFNDSQQSLASAMYLPKIVYDNCNQVLVYQRSIFDVANDVARGDSDWRRYEHLFPFGMAEASYTESPFDSHLAALDYYMYNNKERYEQAKEYFYSDVTKEKAKEKESFEHSFLKRVDDAWENAGIVRKTASIDSVDSIPIKLRSMGIEYCRNLDEIEDLTQDPECNDKFKDEPEKIKDIKNIQAKIVEAEHNRWMMQKLIAGYRHMSSEEQDKVSHCLADELKVDELRDVESLTQNVETIVLRDRVLRKEIAEGMYERVDLGICSFRRMCKKAKAMTRGDIRAIEMIPYLLRGNELLNALILRSKDKRYSNSRHKQNLDKFFWVDKNKTMSAFLYLKRNEVKEADKDRYCKHGFWMADTTVNRELWFHVTGRKPEDFEKGEQLPVVSVSKKEVDDFIDILRKKSGLYFDLPSFKEWETAAAPETERKDEGRWTLNTEKFVTKDNAKSGPKEVRSSSEEKRFLHHIFGNVWEWTRKKDENNDLFKFAGGSWRFTEKECDIKNNDYWWHFWDADSKSDDLGFRLVWKYDYDIQTLKNDENKSIEGEGNSTDVSVFKDSFQRIIHLFKRGKSKEYEDNSMDVVAVENWLRGANHGFKRIESGYFVMGADKDTSSQPGANEGPRHTVHISEPFYMCQVPVTQSLWNAVMGIKEPRLNPTTNRIGDEIPQTDIRWKGDDIEPGVEEFLKTLNKSLKNSEDLKEFVCKTVGVKSEEIKEGNLEFRLPTEAEWEYAAKGGNDGRINVKDFHGFKHEYENGGIKKWDEESELYYRKKKEDVLKYDDYSSNISSNPEDSAWFNQPSIHAAAQKEPNKLGLYDMSGNVWEWCYDHYLADMYDACKIGGNDKVQSNFIKDEYKNKGYITDPVAVDDSYSAHVFRGGSWRSSEWDCRCTRANYWGENYKANDLGFRLVLGRPIADLGKKYAKEQFEKENIDVTE